MPTIVRAFPINFESGITAALYLHPWMILPFGGVLPIMVEIASATPPAGTARTGTGAAGGAFAGSASAEMLKLLLGAILIAAALKAFWRRYG